MTKIDVSQSPPISTLISSLHANLSTSFKYFSGTRDITCFITTNISVKRLSRRLEGKARSTLENGQAERTIGERNKFFSQPRHKYFFLGIKSSFLNSKNFYGRQYSDSSKFSLYLQRPSSNPGFLSRNPTHVYVPSRRTFLRLFGRICTDTHVFTNTSTLSLISK